LRTGDDGAVLGENDEIAGLLYRSVRLRAVSGQLQRSFPAFQSRNAGFPPLTSVHLAEFLG
jgi:hypothetical protein